MVINVALSMNLCKNMVPLRSFHVWRSGPPKRENFFFNQTFTLQKWFEKHSYPSKDYGVGPSLSIAVL